MMKNFIFLLLAGFCFVSSLVNAHEVRPSFLEIVQQTEDTYRVMWKVPAKGDLRLGLYVEFPDSTKILNTPTEVFSGGSYIKRLTIQDELGLFDKKITILGLEATLTEALVRIEHLDGTLQVERLMPDNPVLTVKRSPTLGEVVSTYFNSGVKHIWGGLDHLLFLVCLLFIAGTGKRIFITVTGFTLAHSLTLVLSALDIVQVAIKPVEVIIALSIAFLATEIIRPKRDSLTWRYPIAVSASFGLLHGFGFAAMLNEIGLPQTEVAGGLLSFNLGVEAGQLAVIAAIILGTKLLMYFQPNFSSQHFEKPAAYCVGSLACYWMIERMFVIVV
jgi:hydrogenase/urease accessory protein HupE